ncbi:hypothetical protein Sjap_017829 [Stephania japonica]|uniref:Growth-regulating factor n=1 Tax=Stephania japonica TaxID=461633 RepID=A0AAP0I6W1_9MAGN
MIWMNHATEGGDELVFREDSLVIEVVSLFEVPQELEEVVCDVDVNNDSFGLIAKEKVLKFTSNDGICIDGYFHDFSSQNNVLFYLFKHVETSCDDFIVKAEMREASTTIRSTPLRSFRTINDPEPGRCRRTDGKKWRCAKEVVVDQKYCERHLNRGRYRSKKHVKRHCTTNCVIESTATGHQKISIPLSSSTSTSMAASGGNAQSTNDLNIQRRPKRFHSSIDDPRKCVSKRKDKMVITQDFESHGFSSSVEHDPINFKKSGNFSWLKGNKGLEKSPVSSSNIINAQRLNGSLGFNCQKLYGASFNSSLGLSTFSTGTQVIQGTNPSSSLGNFQGNGQIVGKNSIASSYSLESLGPFHVLRDGKLFFDDNFHTSVTNDDLQANEHIKPQPQCFSAFHGHSNMASDKNDLKCFGLPNDNYTIMRLGNDIGWNGIEDKQYEPNLLSPSIYSSSLSSFAPGEVYKENTFSMPQSSLERFQPEDMSLRIYGGIPNDEPMQKETNDLPTNSWKNLSYGGPLGEILNAVNEACQARRNPSLHLVNQIDVVGANEIGDSLPPVDIVEKANDEAPLDDVGDDFASSIFMNSPPPL